MSDAAKSDLKKGEYITIDPPTTLRSKVRILTGREAQKFDPVKNAEKALDRMSVSFSDWMHEEIERFIDAWERNRQHRDDANRAALYRAAHDMRGQAATLGFPIVGRIAGVFCDVLDANQDEELPEAFLEQFIAAIRAVARETNRGEENTTAVELAENLEGAAKTLLSRPVGQD